MMRETINETITNLGCRIRATGIVALALMCVSFLLAQNSTPPPPAKAAPAPIPQSSPTLPPTHLDESAVLSHLNQLINWHRHSTTGIQPVGLPSDAIYQDNAKTLGSQAVRLGFESAKAEAALLTAQQ